jgi:hypothetical protein
MFKSRTIIYCVFLVLLIIVISNHGENIKNTENFMSIKDAPILDIDKIKTTNLDKNMQCKFDMQCKSNECIKDVGGQFLCL